MKKFLHAFVNFIRVIAVVLIVLVVGVIAIQRIFNNKVTIFGYRVFTIISESMVPKYKINDVLISKTVLPETIKVGDDVVYLGKDGDFKDKVVTHQVQEIYNNDNRYTFLTKGIANTGTDPLVDESQVYGVIVEKTVVLSFLSNIVNNSYGFYFLIFVPIVFLIALEVIDAREDKKKIEEYDKE